MYRTKCASSHPALHRFNGNSEFHIIQAVRPVFNGIRIDCAVAYTRCSDPTDKSRAILIRLPAFRPFILTQFYLIITEPSTLESGSLV